MNEEKRSAVALSYLTGVGAVRARRLLAYAGGFSEALRLSDAAYRELRIPQGAVSEIRSGKALRRADEELSFIERHRIRLIDCLDEEYPSRFGELPDAPLVVYYRGAANLSAARTIGVVGTRSPSVHGAAFCAQLVEELRSMDVTVVSGLAYGIDIQAHRACLQFGVSTVGVLAHGLNQIYPATHRAEAQRMVEEGGLLTEFPSGIRSRKEFFPMRNRLIAGLSDAVIVIESAARGGSMITANLAVGYERPVFAVPGRPGDPKSAGCNLLLKNHRASLIESAADLSYVLGWDQGRPGRDRTLQSSLAFEDLDGTQRRIVDVLRGGGDFDLDRLLHVSELPNGQLAATLLELEIRGIVNALPGKRFALA